VNRRRQINKQRFRTIKERSRGRLTTGKEKEITNAVDGKYLILAFGAKTKRKSLLKKNTCRGTLEKAT